MAVLHGYGPGYGFAGPAPVNTPATPNAAVSGSVVIDGTPVRVAMLALAAAAGIAALKWAGFRFNVGVS